MRVNRTSSIFLSVSGRMRSVFLCRLHLCLLFLATILLVLGNREVQARLDYAEIGYKTSTVFARDNQSRCVMGETYTEARLSRKALGLRLRLNLVHSVPNGDLRWGFGSSSDKNDVGYDGRLIGRISFEERYFQSLLSVSSPDGDILTTLGWCHKADGREEISASVWLRPLGFLRGGLKRSMEYPLPSYSELYYEYTNTGGELSREGGRIDWQAPAWSNVIELQLAPINGLLLESVIRESDFKPSVPKPGESAAGIYLGAVGGLLYDSRIRARYLLKTGWKAAIECRQIEAHMYLKVYDGGRQFAHFGVLKAAGKMWSLRVSRHDLSFGLASGQAEGEVKGSIEAWPFLDGLLRFLGERRHFVGEANVDWNYASMTAPLYHSDRLKLKASVDYLHIRPDLKYATWRPPLFGMGMDDLKNDRLNLIRADLITLALNPVIKLNHWRVRFDFSQLIPISIEKRDEKKSSGKSSDQHSGKTGNSGKGKNHFWGGFNATVSIRAEF